ncbi:MAG: proton-conducting transporter membrane subunit [Canidatus Methanoxibalbensis ujae]|nr:proton-conducting transporter membrane subunit [Candidatus Methanoxibalbensis ujae]MCW7078301.1 proton-conducting transporter membrane subunit [Candidatus Methanoxibalbensis ujae]
MIESLKPLLAILCPVIAAPLILISRNHPNLREFWTIISSFSLFAIVLSMAPTILSDGDIKCVLMHTMLENIDVAFKVDAFGEIFAITASSLWILVSFYSIGYMRSLNEHAQTRYYFCFCWAICGAIGVAMAGNLLTLFIFYEILTVSTYPLVIHEQSDEAISAGRKYLAYLMTAGCFLLAGVILTYHFAGTTDFSRGGIPGLLNAAKSASEVMPFVLLLCFMLGFMKSAWMPFHSWLPTAMIAPTPVSALLHAVAVVKAGAFGIVRTICFVFGTEAMNDSGLWIFTVSVASFTMIVASLFAIAQDNLKRRLAYSTISQLSYIIFGASLLWKEGVMGAMLHIPFHGYMKITLFLCAGAIAVITGKKNISEMAGIGRIIPVTMIAFTIGALGMCGLPPLCGFISKLFMCIGAWEWSSSSYMLALALLLIIIMSSFLDVLYFFPIIKTAFFEPAEPAEPAAAPPHKAAHGTATAEAKRVETSSALYLFMVIPLTITAIYSVVLFILFFLQPVAPDFLSLYIFKLAGKAAGVP